MILGVVGLAYVVRRSVLTDLRILWMTAVAVLRPSRVDAMLTRALPSVDGLR